MKIKLPRRRWILIGCLAAITLAAIGWWQLSGPSGRFTREQYDRIRPGMTSAEVASAMGGRPTGYDFSGYLDPDWELVVADGPFFPVSELDRPEQWKDKRVSIHVLYCNGKTLQKEMWTYVPPWKIKARQWLTWLRELVGL